MYALLSMHGVKGLPATCYYWPLMQQDSMVKARSFSALVKPQMVVVHSLISSPFTVGAEIIYIHVHKDNLPARRLYDHIGFKVYSHLISLLFWIFHLAIEL